MTTLRCRKGDMAYQLAPGPYCGYIVSVGEFLGDVFVKRLCGRVELIADAWQIFSDTIPLHNMAQADNFLLPIHPGDLDETEETSKELESQS